MKYLLLCVLLLTSCIDYKKEIYSNKPDEYRNKLSTLVYSDKINEPQGWKIFCQKYDYKVSFEDKSMKDLSDVFFPLFDNFNYVSDGEGKDEWNIMPDDNLNGDCEDFALTLKMKLIEAGFTKSNVRIAIGRINENPTIRHAVCVVEIKRGTLYICDQSGITPFNEYYIIIEKIQDETEAYWVQVNNDK